MISGLKVLIATAPVKQSILTVFLLTSLLTTVFIVAYSNRFRINAWLVFVKSSQKYSINQIKNENNPIEDEFKKQWLRIQKRRVDWKQILAPCVNNTVLNQTLPGWGKVNETALNTSYLEYMDVLPAGQFSRFFIRTKTNDGRNKTIGGDFWKVILIGPATVAATVFDHGNGSYEAVALIVDPGKYMVKAIIERSLCEGMKDSTPEFYTQLMMRCIKRSVLTKEQGCCLNGQLSVREITVLPSKDNVMKKIRAVLMSNSCTTKCSFIWTELGRWIGNEWVPFFNLDNYSLSSLSHSNHSKEAIYFVGDSVTRQFAENYFNERKAYNVCVQIWKSCQLDIFHLYPRRSKLRPHARNKCTKIDYNEVKKYGDADVEYRPKITLDAIKEAFLQPGMNSSNSLLVLNFNFHYARMLPFAQYKNFIANLTYMLTNKEKLFGSKARVVWRTATALNYRGIVNRAWTSKYLTSDRALLLGAYALSEICRLGIDVLDFYPMSMATPLVRDRVHFKPGTFSKIMDALTWYSLEGEVDYPSRTTKICLAP